MFRAIGRWFKALGYLLTGRIDRARMALEKDPNVVRAKYDEVLRDKTKRIQHYKEAVAGLIAQQEKKMAKIKTLTKEVEKLERLKQGALAKAKQQVTKLQQAGKSKVDIQQDEDYMKCLAAYNDFVATLAEKQERITELEADVGQYGTRIKEHKIQLQSLVREIEDLKAESSDAVADMITAQQEKEIADALSGIAEDGTAKELQDLRDLRQQVKAEARISRELAGTDTKAQEAEFLEYARSNVANNEFDALVGLAVETDTAAQEDAGVVKDKKESPLPE
jgi:phage shock protein A